MSKLGIVLGIISLGMLFFLSSQYREKDSQDLVKMKVYENYLYGFSFTYPDRYELTTKEESDDFQLVLVDKSELVQDRSEGPTSINVYIYKDIEIRDWLKKNESNFNLAVAPATNIVFQGKEAITYEWDGLYRGKTLVFSWYRDVFVLTGTYLEKNDTRYKDFQNILDSFVLHESIEDSVILEYIKKNISILSPQKEVLGGTFYVTQFIRTDRNSGIVEYEDGHNAYKAKVSFSSNDKKGITVISFNLVE